MSWGAGLAFVIAPWIADLPGPDRAEADPSEAGQPGLSPSKSGEEQP